jgi:hypothetical protein
VDRLAQKVFGIPYPPSAGVRRRVEKENRDRSIGAVMNFDGGFDGWVTRLA